MDIIHLILMSDNTIYPLPVDQQLVQPQNNILPGSRQPNYQIQNILSLNIQLHSFQKSINIQNQSPQHTITQPPDIDRQHPMFKRGLAQFKRLQANMAQQFQNLTRIQEVEMVADMTCFQILDKLWRTTDSKLSTEELFLFSKIEINFKVNQYLNRQELQRRLKFPGIITELFRPLYLRLCNKFKKPINPPSSGLEMPPLEVCGQQDNLSNSIIEKDAEDQQCLLIKHQHQF